MKTKRNLTAYLVVILLSVAFAAPTLKDHIFQSATLTDQTTNNGVIAGGTIGKASIVTRLENVYIASGTNGGIAGVGTGGGSVVAVGRIMYVSQDEGDDGTCAPGQANLPCATINHAIEEMHMLYHATSTTSMDVETGSNVLTLDQTGLAYTVGDRVRCVDRADMNNWVEGPVTAYSGTSLTFTADRIHGSGTIEDWCIFLSVNLQVKVFPSRRPYDEPLTLRMGVDIHFETGATLDYTGAGSAIAEDSEPVHQVKITGSGRLFKHGTGDNQHAIEINQTTTHCDVTAEDIKCVMTVVGTNNSAVYLNGGYIKVRSHSIDGVNAAAIRWEDAGTLDIVGVDRISSVGSGISTIDIGGTSPVDLGSNIAHVGWIAGVTQLTAGNNERVFYCHDDCGPQGRYITITAQTCLGDWEDSSTNLLLMARLGIVLPGNFATRTTSRAGIIQFLSPSGSAVDMDIQDFEGAAGVAGMIIDSASTQHHTISIQRIAGVTINLDAGVGNLWWLTNTGSTVNDNGGTFTHP